jgi:hypothetical protein
MYVIANHGLSIESSLYKISITGAPVKWEIPVGFSQQPYGIFYKQRPCNFCSGCITTYNFWQIGTF